MERNVGTKPAKDAREFIVARLQKILPAFRHAYEALAGLEKVSAYVHAGLRITFEWQCRDIWREAVKHWGTHDVSAAFDSLGFRQSSHRRDSVTLLSNLSTYSIPGYED